MRKPPAALTLQIVDRRRPGMRFGNPRLAVPVVYALACVWAVCLVVPSAGRGQTRAWNASALGTGLAAVRARPVGGVDLRAPLSGAFGSIELGAPTSVPVGANPSGLAVSDASHTVYSVNQQDNTVSVIDTQACNAAHPAGCRHGLATIQLRGGINNGPVGAILAADGESLYVTSSGQNAVAVIDASTCNATRTSGCTHGPVATVAAGQLPVAMVEDPHTHTLYVANDFGNSVSAIDTERCNADQIAGCGEAASAVAVGTGPSALALDPEKHTMYVANVDDNTVSVVDTKRCNAQHTAGCGSTPPTQAVGGAPAAIGFSERSDTVYVANGGLNLEAALVRNANTVSVMNADDCNAEHPQGCSAAALPAVRVGSQPGPFPQGLTVDERRHDVYVADFNDDTLSVIDGARCNARDLTGCTRPVPTVQMGAGPSAIAVAPSAQTIYIADGADGAVAVIDERTCTDEHHSGCRPAPAPTMPLAPDHQLASAAIDVHYHTTYVIDYGVNFGGPYTLDLIDTSRCHAGSTPGCKSQPPVTVPTPGGANDVAVDPSTHTLYVSQGGGGAPAQLEVIAVASCNATVSTCGTKAIVSLGGDGSSPGAVALDSATSTVYVGNDAHTSVIDARRCNAADMTGCAAQPAAAIAVGYRGRFAVAPDTLYATVFSSPAVPGVVDVLDTRHCRAADTTQCSAEHPPTVSVGSAPSDPTFDALHHTLYVPDNGFGERPGLLSMIDTRHCNGDDTSQCASQTPPTTPMRRAPLAAILDAVTHTLYVTNFANASASSIDTAACNAVMLAGCPRVPAQVVTASGPDGAALDPRTHTLYVPSYYDGTVSIIPTATPIRPGGTQ